MAFIMSSYIQSIDSFNRLLSRVKSMTTILILMLAASSCGNNDYNDLPREIQQFINQYFPGQGVSSFDESAGTYTVNLDNSASLVFNPSMIWTAVDGNGSPVPQQFLFDQFPSVLYDYIVTTGNLGEVYAVTRNAGIYTVTLHNYIIDYNVATEEIRQIVIGSGDNG